MVVQVIESLAHGEIEQADRIHASQFQMGAVVMRISVLLQLAERKPLGTERDHTAQSVIDASFLLKLERFAGFPVTVQVQNGRNLAGQRFGLIGNRRCPKAGYDFVPELAHAVALARLHHARILISQRRDYPLPGPAVENDVIQQMGTQSPGFSRPCGRGLRRDRLDEISQQISAELKLNQAGRLDRLRQRPGELLRARLATKQGSATREEDKNAGAYRESVAQEARAQP